jgi:signal transduction histidine kinase/CheY-like chemotaxis protein
MTALGSPVWVLVVDDNPDHRLLTERALMGHGFEVRTANSGEAALDSLSGIDLVLLDHGLPRMTGTQVLEAIRAQDGPPVIMVTGRGSEEVAVEALRGGAIDYVAKSPGYLATLPAVVGRAWRHHDLARRAAELERLALLVTSARERGDVLPDIARGARMLLRADACWVLVSGEHGLVLEGMDGDGALDPGVAEEARAVLSGTAAEHDPDVASDRLLVPLVDHSEVPIGALVVTSREPRRFLPEEVRLAHTFASFAGLALANLTRFELERRLVHQLQTMLDMRSRLVSSVSHELRTPLTSILGFSEAMVDHWDSMDEGTRQSFVRKIHDHSEELARLVDGLLDYATVEAGKVRVQLETFDVASCLTATMESLAPLLQGREVDVDVRPFQVRGDPALVRRTLSNLVSNAAKYSPEGTPILVRTVRLPNACRIEVVDRGPGLTSEEAARAFEPFWRADPDGSPMRGTGLGLSLVREYSRLMHGDLGVDTSPGEGATFYFTLPLAAQAAEALA